MFRKFILTAFTEHRKQLRTLFSLCLIAFLLILFFGMFFSSQSNGWWISRTKTKRPLSPPLPPTPNIHRHIYTYELGVIYLIQCSIGLFIFTFFVILLCENIKSRKISIPPEEIIGQFLLMNELIRDHRSPYCERNIGGRNLHKKTKVDRYHHRLKQKKINKSKIETHAHANQKQNITIESKTMQSQSK